MALAVYIPAAVILPNSGGTITQIDDIPFDPQLDDLSIRAAGATYPGFTGSNRSQASYAFSTTQVKTVLDYCTTEAVCRAHTSGNCDIEYQLAKDLATREPSGSSVHHRHRFTRSVLAWESLEAPESGPASISLKIFPASTDDTNPITISNTATLSSSATVSHVYGLGPVKIDGTLYCVDKWSLNMGVEWEQRHCSGGPYLRWASVKAVRPELSVTLPNQAEALSTWSTGGTPVGVAVIAFLRKRAGGGINVANATAEHIAITGTAGTIKPSGRNEIKISLHNIAIDTASAIS